MVRIEAFLGLGKRQRKRKCGERNPHLFLLPFSYLKTNRTIIGSVVKSGHRKWRSMSVPFLQRSVYILPNSLLDNFGRFLTTVLSWSPSSKAQSWLKMRHPRYLREQFLAILPRRCWSGVFYSNWIQGRNIECGTLDLHRITEVSWQDPPNLSHALPMFLLGSYQCR